MKFELKWRKNTVLNPGDDVDKQIQGLKKELGKEKYNEIVVRAFVENILKESPVIKDMQRRIKDLEAGSLGILPEEEQK